MAPAHSVRNREYGQRQLEPAIRLARTGFGCGPQSPPPIAAATRRRSGRLVRLDFSRSTNRSAKPPPSQPVPIVNTRSNDNPSAATVDPVARAFAQRLRHRLGKHLREVRLFGSRARGDARNSSDYDVLVVVDQRTPEIRSTILDIEVDLLGEYDVLVTSVLRSEDEWRVSQNYPFARNIAREGVSL